MSLEELIASEKPKSRLNTSTRRPQDARVMDVEKTILKPRRSRSPSRGSSRRIVKISNMPPGLSWQELKDALSSIGPVERADVDGDVGIVVFRNSKDANEAIRVYNGGLMNGQKISAGFA